MTAIKSQKENTIGENNLFKDYYWFHSNIYNKFQKATDEFFQKEFKLRFMGITLEDNVFFYGDEYFVNKIPVNKMSSIIIKISSSLVSSLLDNTLGSGETSFELKKLTDIEAMLLKSFTFFAYKNIEDFIDKTEVNKKIIKNSKDYSFTFYVKDKIGHAGKIILTIPEFMLTKAEPSKYPERFGIVDFKTVKTELSISVGSAKIALNDIKAIEEGDIIVLDNSDINKMAVIWEDNEIKFKINPNPSLIISVDNNGGNEMEEETLAKSQNMWDSILVDIVAEFDNVKLTLGELKQISEGLVIDVGSVYDNKIKLRVENQVIAAGELVILNDRYGVRIDSVKKSKEEPVKPVAAAAPVKEPKAEQPKKPAAAKPAAKPASAAAKKPVKPAPAQNQPKAEGDENFDYSDFEIEDESI